MCFMGVTCVSYTSSPLYSHSRLHRQSQHLSCGPPRLCHDRQVVPLQAGAGRVKHAIWTAWESELHDACELQSLAGHGIYDHALAHRKNVMQLQADQRHDTDVSARD